ncbi:hypothetical protein Dacet_0720 [Denitrovibrio acetiphilus DSM 12809]|uniref:Uncharacterized protein n=1 Tax=Denitrovibrio acetiphilus (strain DSM 12809 / NBRC 114555 / N2460) TaxID=522772 RepID=D4H4W0_DENA2|nr:hypothetical protein [Denitrovibrio acetiphilus]ADD67504.1 hypothetical protein Dacet_0720 [Denitrovibrio acetiphilus DSM 12809]
MKEFDEIEMERRINNLQSLSRLSEALCRTLELPIDPAEMAVDMEKALEQSLIKNGIINDYKE